MTNTCSPWIQTAIQEPCSEESQEMPQVVIFTKGAHKDNTKLSLVEL